MRFGEVWEENERVALLIGLKIEEYWELNPRQFEKCVEVYKEREEMIAREMDVNNFNLGKYMAIAFHSPKKYPRKPFLSEDSVENKVMSEEEMERMMWKNTILLGGKVK